MIKIRLLSDIHCEFHKDGGDSFFGSLPDCEADVIVVAGDLCDYKSLSPSLEKLSKRFEDYIILLTNGNHECYSNQVYSITDTENEIRRIIKDKKLDNINYLQNESYNICITSPETGEQTDYTFHGCTLWFPYRYGHTVNGEWAMNDFYQIKDCHKEVGVKNRESLKYLENNVKSSDIVITHHLPSIHCVHPKYRLSNLNSFFVGGAAHILTHHKPKLFVSGHTHLPFDFIHEGGTRCVCNPVGYPNEGVPFKNDLVLEVK